MTKKRIIVVVIIVLLTSIHTWGVPAYPERQLKQLADGSTVSLRLVGDEVYSYWVTDDGRIAEEQRDGRFVVTDQPVPSPYELRARREAHGQMVVSVNGGTGSSNNGVLRMPTGSSNPTRPQRVLVLLVEYQDVRFQSENGRFDFWDSFNKPGYDYNGATGSVADYFDAQSNGQYQPLFDVIGPLTLPHEIAYYGEEGIKDEVEHNDLYIADFVTDAVEAAESAGCDFSQYDSDEDGYVDIVYMIYAGQGQAAGGSSSTIWPHNWTLYTALDKGLTHGTSGYYANKWYLGIDNLPKFDGKTINNYVCSAELRSDGKRSGIGTPCHEFGHVLGLPDYYDTQYGENDKNGITPESWSIMCSGSYNNNGNTPPNYSIFDKYYLGWAEPKFLGKDERLNRRMGTGYDDAYQITGGSTRVPYSDPGTVYYIETRQNEGWDAYLPGHGMIVWKVEYNKDAWDHNTVNNTAGAPRYTIVPADGKTSNYGKYSDPFPGTYKPVTEFSPFEGCALTDIYELAGRIGFKYNGGTEQYLFSYEATGVHCTAPEMNITSLDYNLNMEFVPDEGYSLADESCWEVYMGKNRLSYGTDFTYDEASHLMNIPAVKDHIVVYAHAWKKLTWIAEDTVYSTSLAFHDMIIPPFGKACEGRVFIGWTPEVHYQSGTTAPETVEYYSELGQSDTFYAVYATEQGDYASIATVIFQSSESDGSDISNTIQSYVSSSTGIVSYSGTKVFAGKDGVKLGSSKVNGSLTLNLEKAIRTSSIRVTASQWGNDASSITVSVNGGTVFGSTQSLSPEEDNITFQSEAPMEIESITIQSSKRAYISGVLLTNEALYGEYDYRCSIAPVSIRFFDREEELSHQLLREGDRAEVPEAPEGCDQYAFAGWWTEPLATDNTTAYEWVSDFTVTKAQDYHAVYSRIETVEHQETQTTEYVFTDKSWSDSGGTWQSTKDGGQYLKDNHGVQVTANSSGAGAATKTEMSDVQRVVVSYCTNASKGAGSITVSAGASEQTSEVTKNGGTALRDLIFDFDHASGIVSFVVNCTTNSIYIHSVTIVSGTEGETITYYTTVPVCEEIETGLENAPSEHTPYTKILRDGQVIILRDGKEYNTSGIPIYSK